MGGKLKENEEEKSPPFDEFFTFPQYSTSPCVQVENSNDVNDVNCHVSLSDETVHQTRSSIADVEVTMVESHANVKIRSKKRSKQLLRLVSGLCSLRFTILHLNVTTVAQTVLYSLSLKVC